MWEQQQQRQQQQQQQQQQQPTRLLRDGAGVAISGQAYRLRVGAGLEERRPWTRQAQARPSSSQTLAPSSSSSFLRVKHPLRVDNSNNQLAAVVSMHMLHCCWANARAAAAAAASDMRPTPGRISSRESTVRRCDAQHSNAKAWVSGQSDASAR